MKKMITQFKKRKIMFLLVLIMAGMSASAIVFNPSFFRNFFTKTVESSAGCVEITFPEKMKVGEQISLSANRTIDGSGQMTGISWVVAQSKGDGYFATGGLSSTESQPVLTARTAGKLNMTVTLYDSGFTQDSGCERQTITSNFTIEILE